MNFRIAFDRNVGCPVITISTKELNRIAGRIKSVVDLLSNRKLPINENTYLSYGELLESIGFHDTMSLAAIDSRNNMAFRLFCIWCVRQIQHLFVNPEFHSALEVVEKYVAGKASAAELKVTYDDVFKAKLKFEDDVKGHGEGQLGWAFSAQMALSELTTNEHVFAPPLVVEYCSRALTKKAGYDALQQLKPNENKSAVRKKAEKIASAEFYNRFSQKLSST